ncbi:MAG: peptide deformylase [Pseudomonadota bacterium]
MAVRKIIRMGHPHLRVPAQPVDTTVLGSADFQRLLDDMVDTLHDYGGIGLAAPQIDEPLRLAIIEIPGGHTRYGEIAAMPLTVFVNPTIEVLDPTPAGYWEGCLSVPGLRGFVERPQHVRIRYTDVDGNPQTLEMQGFWATVFQHEFDHLDGRLYIDHITDPTKLVFEEEFNRYLADSA